VNTIVFHALISLTHRDPLFALAIKIQRAHRFPADLFFPLTVQNLAVNNDFRAVVPVTSGKSLGISHAMYGMLIAEPFSDRHETAGVRPKR